MNTITIVGNIGKDPENRVTRKGTAVVYFSVADNKKRPGGQGNEWVSQWWRCTAFKELAEAIVQELHSGDRVEVTGRLDQQEYVSKEGEKRTGYNVLVNRVSKVVRPMRINNGDFNNMGNEVVEEDIPF